jgi:hypothetical protein
MKKARHGTELCAFSTENCRGDKSAPAKFFDQFDAKPQATRYRDILPNRHTVATTKMPTLEPYTIYAEPPTPTFSKKRK